MRTSVSHVFVLRHDGSTVATCIQLPDGTLMKAKLAALIRNNQQVFASRALGQELLDQNVDRLHRYLNSGSSYDEQKKTRHNHKVKENESLYSKLFDKSTSFAFVFPEDYPNYYI